MFSYLLHVKSTVLPTGQKSFVHIITVHYIYKYYIYKLKENLIFGFRSWITVTTLHAYQRGNINFISRVIPFPLPF